MQKISRILRELQYIRRIKKTKPELYELNSLWHDEFLLLQELQYLKKNGEASQKFGVEIQTREETEILSRKIPKVVPETYPCGLVVQAFMEENDE